MAELNELFKSDDFKNEKHVPVIEAPESLGKGKTISLSVTVGKQIPHPNTTEHHIAWLRLFFLPEGTVVPYEIGSYACAAHGASTQGPNTSGIYTEATVTIAFKTEKSGTLLASSYCNIHGLWQSSKKLSVA
jgi:superoxide reductase